MLQLLYASVLTLTFGSITAGKLTVGEQAPAFEMPGSDGQTYTLEQFLGKKAVIIAWYPKAFTGG